MDLASLDNTWIAYPVAVGLTAACHRRALALALLLAQAGLLGRFLELFPHRSQLTLHRRDLGLDRGASPLQLPALSTLLLLLSERRGLLPGLLGQAHGAS